MHSGGRFLIRFGWIGLLILWMTPGLAQPLQIKNTDQVYTLNAQLTYLLTPNEMSLKEVLASEQAFYPHQKSSVLNLGYSNQTLWLKFDIDNQSALDQWILEFGYYPPLAFDLYLKNHQGAFHRIDTDKNQWPSRYLAYDLPLANGLNQVLIKMETSASLTVPLTISSHKTFAEEKQGFYFTQALYFGWVASLILYNLFLFLSLRDGRFGYYVLFATALASALAFYYGFPQQWLGMPYDQTTTIIGTVLFNLASLLAIVFARRFLNTPLYSPVGDNLLLLTSLTFFGSIVTVLIWPASTTPSWLLSLGAPIGAIIAMIVAFICLIRGYKQARFFLIAWSTLLVATIIATLRNFGWVETSPLTAHSIQIGSALEMLLLAIALADSMRIERIEHDRLQQASLEDSLENQKILTSNQSRLERKVFKRTQNIQASLYKVQSAFKTYMRFGAMISHEFKNPLNAMLNQIETLNMERQHGIDHSEKRLASIEGQAKRLKTLFEHWLSTDQLISGQLSTDVKTVLLQPWLQEAIELVESIHSDRHFEFHVEVNPTTRVKMDATLVQIGLFNLVDNACRYSPEASRITLVAIVSDQTLALGVVNQPDTPMTEERLKDSLETYCTLSSKQQESTGLGLSLVKLIAETHKGSLAANLVEQDKVQFVMRLPVVFAQ
ncbi:sensor histidine kinase [Hydrogenovibrio halophilus]|uniref:sensor histidine kinase n=1 Tax=Hydrogenovibrio halophilus TaxID=373391 RepID=UPI000360FA03|nr:sensor histidine kinase [Hydrogenovibrio halophilus]